MLVPASQYILVGKFVDLNTHYKFLSDFNNDGYPYWTPQFDIAKRFKDPNNIPQISEPWMLTDALVEIRIYEVKISLHEISACERASMAKTTALIEIDKLERELQQKRENLAKM